MTKPRKRRSQKAGLAPGALVHIGEVAASKPVMVLTSFGPQGLIERELDSLAGFDEVRKEFPVHWLNVYGLHDPELLASIGHYFSLHPLVVEDILNTDQRPKVDVYADYLFVVGRLLDPRRHPHVAGTDQISLILARGFVLSFQERRSGTFDPLRQRLRSNNCPLRTQGIDHLAYSLLDAMVDAYFSVVEQMGDRCDALESEILGRPKRDVLAEAHRVRQDISTLRRSIWPMREVIGTLQRSQTAFFGDETRPYLHDIHDHTVHMLEQLEDSRELLTGLLDIYQNRISNRVNLEVRTLTLLTTVFMPAALIAGIFGMNFQVMPWVDAPDGFVSALLLMGFVGLALFLVFWSRKLFR